MEVRIPPAQQPSGRQSAAAPAPSVVARFLGGFRVEADGDIVQLSGARMSRAILAYILINPDRHHLRSRLAGMFWPDVSEQNARRRLRTALWKIRSGFGEVGVTIFDQHPDAVAVADGVELWVDVVEYGRLIAAAEEGPQTVSALLAQADELYRGDFLAGHYNEWVFEEQEHLRATQMGVLRRLMKARESEGRYERALLLAQRAVALDQLDEGSHRDVIRINALLSRPEEAQRAYRHLQGLLSAELGAEPSRESQQLADDVARQTDGTLGIVRASDKSRAPVFVARSRERNLLLERLESVRSGRGSVLLVEGPPGVGKTSLIAQVAEDAKWRNVEVVWGDYQDRSPEAFEGIKTAIEAALTPLRVQQLRTVVDPLWLAEASKILPALTHGEEVPLRRHLTGDDARLRMYEALVQVLVGLARIYPTLLVLEDVHWADVDSLHVLDALAGRIADIPMAVVLTYRRHEMVSDPSLWPLMQSIDRHRVTTRTELGDLDTEAVAELLTSIGGFRADVRDLAARLVAQTSGNPLFVVETLKSLRDLGPDEVVPDELPVAESVGEIVEARLERLAASSTAVVAAAAVAARPMSVQQLTMLTGLPADQVLESVTAVVDREILNDDPDGLLFSHALVRRIAYLRIEPERRQQLHAAAAQLLEEASAAPAGIAHHHVEAHQWPQAVGWSYQAAQAAESVAAFDTAGAHYATAREAIDEADVDADLVWSVLRGAEHVADVLGDRQLQESLLSRMNPLASDPNRDAELRLRHARLLANTDRLEAARDVAERGIGLTDETDERLEVLIGQVLVWSGEVRSAIERLQTFAADGSTSAGLHRMLGVAFAEVQEYDEAQHHLAQALTTMEAADDAEGTAGVLSMIGTVYAEAGRFEEATHALNNALAIARSIGFRQAEAECLVNLATISAMSNRPGSALQLFDQATTAFSAIGHRRGTALVGVNMASLLRDLVGDQDQAKRLALDARDYFGDAGDFLRESTCEAVLAGIDAMSDPGTGIGRYEEIAVDLVDRDADWLALQVEESLIRLLVQEERIGEARSRLDGLSRSKLVEAANPTAMLRCDALTAMVLTAEGRIAEASASASAVLDQINAGTPDGYRLAFMAFVSLGSDPAKHGDRIQALAQAHDLLESALDDLSEEQVGQSRQLPVHRAIEEAYQELMPRTAVIDLPARGTVTVKGETEYMAATVTVYHPDDRDIEQAVVRRRMQLGRILGEIDEQGGQASIKVLARLLDTSQATIKRDLAAIRGASPKQESRT